MKSLARYIADKSDFVGVAMIRLVYNGGFWDYNHWKISGQNLFFFDENMRVGHILWTTDPIKEVDENHVVYCPDNRAVGLELFHGGATL